MAKVEECAKAACKAAWIESGEDWSLAGDEQKDEFRRIARAVLICLLNVSPEALEAGTDVAVGCCTPTQRDVKEIIGLVLQHILSEGTDNG